MCPKNDYIYRNDIIGAMSFYDILTIVIFLGLPVVSAVISAKEKKNKSKKPLQGGQEHGEDIKDIIKIILAEMNGETTAQQDEDPEEEPSRPWQEPVVEDDEESSMTWEEPVLETPSQTKPWQGNCQEYFGRTCLCQDDDCFQGCTGRGRSCQVLRH